MESRVIGLFNNIDVKELMLAFVFENKKYIASLSAETGKLYTVKDATNTKEIRDAMVVFKASELVKKYKKSYIEKWQSNNVTTSEMIEQVQQKG